MAEPVSHDGGEAAADADVDVGAEVVADAKLEREALRLVGRYVDEVVLGFGLCPWAEPALRGGRVGRAVCVLATPAPADCMPYIDAFAASSAPSPSSPPCDIGLLVFPRHAGGWAAFDSFAERVRRRERERRGGAAGAEFLVAAFHPDGATTFTGPNQLVSLLRRTPDPLLQFVRAELIDRLKATRPEVSSEVGAHNHDSLVADPSRLAALEGAIRSIRADRDQTYARVGG
jgi:hypothetical protein